MAIRVEPVQGVIRVAAASTGNLTLSGAQTVDGVSVTGGMLVLAKDQSTGAEKGVYLASSAGAWVMADPGSSDGLMISVLAGTTNADTTWRVTNDITWGSGTPTFENQTGGTGAGGMVTLTGSQELTNKTLTTMVVKTGLTASGSAANNFSGSTGDFTLSTGEVAWSGAAGKKVTLTQGVATTGSPYALKVVAGAHTTLTASAEANDAYFDLSRTVQFATGALTTQRAFLIDAPTYAFAGASTVTNAATLAIENAPQAGANATLTNSYALWVQAGMVKFDGAVNFGRGTVNQATNVNTDVTCNASSGVITTQSASTAAATMESGFTLNNSCISSTSVITLQIVGYSGTHIANGIPYLAVAAPGSGTVGIKIGNIHAANALNGTMKIHFIVA